jgi:hypothetical protein
MAPNRVALSKNAGSNKSLFSTVYDEATNPENTTIVRSLMVFTVRAELPSISTSTSTSTSA